MTLHPPHTWLTVAALLMLSGCTSDGEGRAAVPVGSAGQNGAAVDPTDEDSIPEGAASSAGAGSSEAGSEDGGSGETSPLHTGGTVDPVAPIDGSGGSTGGTGGAAIGTGGQTIGSAGSTPQAGATAIGGELDAWYANATVSKRRLLPVPSAYSALGAAPIRTQLQLYDPGSLIRCDVNDDPAYAAVVDALGGVTWGYAVSVLEDESKPRFQAGFQDYLPMMGDTSSPAGGAVEIEEADIVGLSPTSALYLSPEHGLLMVDLSGSAPVFDCATKLPGQVSKFFFYQGQLVVMTEQLSGAARHSYLLHFDISAGALNFVESIDLGAVRVLDTRRFNERLVVYTDLTLEDEAAVAGASQAPVYYEPRGLHRTLRVFTLGNTLSEEMTDTLLDTSPNANYLTDGGIAPNTQPGTLVSDSSNFGGSMWASDHYFVVTEQLRHTYLASWETRTYSVCIESHTVDVPYQDCRTLYEEQPNPDYTPPDNSGGDRACNGTTLSDCLRAVSRASNPTIQVPVGRQCEERMRTNWICDARESRSYTYPNLESDYATRLYIYEYTDSGFVRLDTNVSEITDAGLDTISPDSVVSTLTTSTETYDLAIPGRLQTLYFQNGMLYAIADGTLQVYAMGGPSLVRTSSLNVVDSNLQTSLFTSDKLYLSDFGYSGNRDQSILRVVDLSNPAFPRQASADRTLPGGHSTILPVDQGILTVGTVANFAPGIQQVIKLGMFTDPFASELSYLILGTDLDRTYLGDSKSLTFDSTAQRLFLPYFGSRPDSNDAVARVGVSHLEGESIVSEGAIPTPELSQRVRPRPEAADQFLSFASSSIEWLRPADPEWAATPVLEYFKPIALYRVNDEDDYIEVLRLGQNCKLHFGAADSINLTRAESTSEAFSCGSGTPWAYDNNIVFAATSGVSFTPEGDVAELTADEITQLYDLRIERPYCLFSTALMMDVSIDFDSPPPVEDMICYSPDEYQTARQEALDSAAN